MTDQLTRVLERAAGPVPPAPPVVTLLDAGRRGRRRRTATMATTAVAGIAVAALGTTTVWQPTPTDVVGQVSVDPPAGQPVTATGGTPPTLPSDSSPVHVDARVLPGVGPDVRLAAVANDGRVAVSAAGHDLTVTRPDAADATALSLPGSVTRCWSLAFDQAGDLWALCEGSDNGNGSGAVLLRYLPDVSEPTVHTVTDLLRSVLPTVRYASLWVHDGQVAAVVPTDDTDPPADGEEPAWGDASTVVLAEDGDILTTETTTIEALPSLGVDTSGSVAASAGRRIIDRQTPGGRTIEVAWLNHAASVILETGPAGWDLVSTDDGDAFVGSAVALTYKLFNSDAARAYGIVADGEGTTTVMQLPTPAEGMTTLPDRPSPTPTTTIRVAPDGSVHLLAADGSALTTAELPTGNQ